MKLRTLARSAAAALLIAGATLLGMGTAVADVTSQSTSEEPAQVTTHEGTTNDAVDSMANNGPGLVEGDGVKYVRKIVAWIPQFDETGAPILDANGKQVSKPKWADVPIGNGLPDAKIVHYTP